MPSRSIPNEALMTTSIIVQTTATQLSSENSQRQIVRYYNNGSTSIYIISTSSLTTAYGYPVAAGAETQIFTIAAVWARTAGSTADVRIMRED